MSTRKPRHRLHAFFRDLQQDAGDRKGEINCDTCSSLQCPCFISFDFWPLVAGIFHITPASAPSNSSAAWPLKSADPKLLWTPALTTPMFIQHLLDTGRQLSRSDSLLSCSLQPYQAVCLLCWACVLRSSSRMDQSRDGHFTPPPRPQVRLHL